MLDPKTTLVPGYEDQGPGYTHSELADLRRQEVYQLFWPEMVEFTCAMAPSHEGLVAKLIALVASARAAGFEPTTREK